MPSEPLSQPPSPHSTAKLSEKIKQKIRECYKSIGQSLPNFHPRQQQTLLIAEIAKTLAGEYSKDRKIITIEAGTGTGKSLAYSLGAIPLALTKQKKCVLLRLPSPYKSSLLIKIYRF